MEYRAAAPVFTNWSIEELEAEMMECYHHIRTIPRPIPYEEKQAITEMANAAMSVLNFMFISQVVPSSFKATLEPIYNECRVRINAVLQRYTPQITKRLIETHFGKAQKGYQAGGNEAGECCPECDEIDCLESLCSGEVRCFECGHTYYP
ncbi:hypothetical protein KW429_11840 [Vibrio fluvialis]|nr:hypothetical protein [Vibrio fluvialis]